DKLVSSLGQGNPYYKLIGFFDTEADSYIKHPSNQHIQKYNYNLDIEDFVKQNRIHEIIIGTNTNIGFIHTELLKLMEIGISIKDYSHTYESSFYKIPVDLIEKDFYRHFLFSRSNNNKLYLLVVRMGEIIFS